MKGLDTQYQSRNNELHIIYAFSDIFTGHKKLNEILGVHKTDELLINT